jgi:hypothetical protein
MLNCFYAWKSEFCSLFTPQLIQLTSSFEEKFPSLNLFINLDKTNIYSGVGRFQNQKEALKLNDDLIIFLKYHLKNSNLKFINQSDIENVHDIIAKAIGE